MTVSIATLYYTFFYDGLFLSFFFYNLIFLVGWQSPRKGVNAVLKKEADYFSDIVILPFIDRYELVVLKTIAICEFTVSHSLAR